MTSPADFAGTGACRVDRRIGEAAAASAVAAPRWGRRPAVRRAPRGKQQAGVEKVGKGAYSGRPGEALQTGAP